MFISIAILVFIAACLYLVYLNKSDAVEPTFVNNETDAALIVRDRFKILPVQDLIAVLNLQPSINKIQMDLGLSNENWAKDALPFLHSYIEFVQRLPASESHHHAGDGGLVRHTLDVAQLALVAANSRSWPPGAKTEDIPKLTSVWKYGIMCAAILHDVGKTLTAFKIELYETSSSEDKILWVADAGNMLLMQRKYYRVEFPTHKAEYKLHGEIAWTFFQALVPEHVRQWIAISDPNLIAALRSYLTGKRDNSPFVEIITDADKVSTARDLRHGSRQRFSTSKVPPLIEVVMETLRTIMSTERSAYFSTAITAGGDMFRVGDIVYIMSKHVPDHVRSYLKKVNSTAAPSFPSDNQRIFDTLLEYGAVIAPAGQPHKAITTIGVQFIKDSGEVKDQHFKVLAFKTSTLFDENSFPAEFQGKLAILQEMEQAFTAAANNTPQTSADAETVSSNASAAENKVSNTKTVSDSKPGPLSRALDTLSSLAQIPPDAALDESGSPSTETETATKQTVIETDNAIIDSTTGSASKDIDIAAVKKELEVDVDSVGSVDDVLGLLDSVFGNLALDQELEDSAPVMAKKSPAPPTADEVVTLNVPPMPLETDSGKATPSTQVEADETNLVKTVEPTTVKNKSPKKKNSTMGLNQLAAIMGDIQTPSKNTQEKQSPKVFNDEAIQLEKIDTAQTGIDIKLAQDKSKTTAAPRPVSVDTGSVTLGEMYMLDQKPIAQERITEIPETHQNPQEGQQQTFVTGDEALRQNHKLLREEGMRFLNWLSDGLGNGSLEINNSDAVVHFIEEGMLMVTPRVFALYTGVTMTRGNPQCPTAFAQKGFIQLGLHQRNKRGAIWQINERNKPSQRIFSAILIPESRLKNIIQLSSRPQNNTTLVIMKPLGIAGEVNE